MPLTEAIGWASSLILIVTIGSQVAKQWRDHTSAGVSIWLFVGQLAASVGFTIYSLMLQNWVFAITNGIMIVNGLLGYAITLHHRRIRAKSAA
jgi:MtN3 and saliva related transmembrane protein